MSTSQSSNVLSRPSPRQGNQRRFSADESAMIRQYERVHAEWDQQLDLLERPDCTNRAHLLETAELLDRQLTTMEWKLPDAYTCPNDAAPPVGGTSIASAFARLLHNHRQTTGRPPANV